MSKIQTLVEELQKDRKIISDKSAPLKDKRLALQEQIAPLEAEVRELTKQIREIESDKLIKLDKQISTLHKALGAKSLAADTK